MTAVVSIGSGTIPAGRKTAYVNDSNLTSGSVVSIVLENDMSQAAGGAGLKYINFTVGSPVNGQAFQVVLNGATDKLEHFSYAIIR